MALKRHRKHGTHSSSSIGGGWEVIYTGFVLILLCFFIMLCSFSTMERSKVTRFVRSFNLAVNILTGGLKLEPGDIILPASEDIVDEKDPLAGIFKDVITKARSLGIDSSVDLEMRGKTLVMRLANAILFQTGSAQILPGSIPLLKKVGAIISSTPHAVCIEGHTDNRPIHTRRYPSNWELSTARAVNVLRFLVNRAGVPAGRISAAGFGAYQPLSANDTAADRARNRRVEIVFQGLKS